MTSIHPEGSIDSEVREGVQSFIEKRAAKFSGK
jgi:hypothetical protein